MGTYPYVDEPHPILQALIRSPFPAASLLLASPYPPADGLKLIRTGYDANTYGQDGDNCLQRYVQRYASNARGRDLRVSSCGGLCTKVGQGGKLVSGIAAVVAFQRSAILQTRKPLASLPL